MLDFIVNRQFIEIEKDIKDLYVQIKQLQETAEKSNTDLSVSLRDLEKQLVEKRKIVTSNLTSWQRVQLSRHPDRPYTLAYIKRMCEYFTELHGDRGFRDDKAIVGGLAKLGNRTIMIIGHQKGINTKMRQMRNFGMANPEGYRKALRLMKLAEKFNIPVVTLVDTPGAYHGPEAEERGQGEAIAHNIFEMVRLKVPIISVIIGEGASGGALGIGVGDKIFMLENTWYTVISPESCASILWRTWDKKETAAEQLRLTPTDMKGFGLIDDIIDEPYGGAHWDYDEISQTLKNKLITCLDELCALTHDQRLNHRINKYYQMGIYKEE